MKIDLIKTYECKYYRCYEGSLLCGKKRYMIAVVEMKKERQWVAHVYRLGGHADWFEVTHDSKGEVLRLLKSIFTNMGVVK